MNTDSISIIAEGLTDHCKTALATREHAVIGVSPFNSYFSEERIKRLAQWGIETFSTMHIFVPDEPAAYTLQAIGYSREDATYKARRQANYLRNKIIRALTSCGVSDQEARQSIIGWQELVDNPEYTSTLRECTELYQQPGEFQTHCRSAASWVLEKKMSDDQALSAEAVECAVKYLLSEIPLFINTVGILNVASSVFCYHQVVPFIQALYDGQFALKAEQRQGFVKVETRKPTDML